MVTFRVPRALFPGSVSAALVLKMSARERVHRLRPAAMFAFVNQFAAGLPTVEAGLTARGRVRPGNRDGCSPVIVAVSKLLLLASR